jgi:pimeloyl-ACP methyl ester carboxylesterase
MRRLVLFAHGKESGPWGAKITGLAAIAAQFDADVISTDYSDLASPDARVARLLALALPAHEQLVLVGSSMGGYVMTVASATLKPAGLFVLAPAFGLPGYAQQQPQARAGQVCLVHGWDDAIVPVANSIAFAGGHRCALHLLASDHRLTNAQAAIEALFDDFLGRALGWHAAAAPAAPRL